jgi:hypothetical protein
MDEKMEAIMYRLSRFDTLKDRLQIYDDLDVLLGSSKDIRDLKEEQIDYYGIDDVRDRIVDELKMCGIGDKYVPEVYVHEKLRDIIACDKRIQQIAEAIYRGEDDIPSLQLKPVKYREEREYRFAYDPKDGVITMEFKNKDINMVICELDRQVTMEDLKTVDSVRAVIREMISDVIVLNEVEEMTYSFKCQVFRENYKQLIRDVFIEVEGLLGEEIKTEFEYIKDEVFFKEFDNIDYCADIGGVEKIFGKIDSIKDNVVMDLLHRRIDKEIIARFINAVDLLVCIAETGVRIKQGYGDGAAPNVKEKDAGAYWDRIGSDVYKVGWGDITGYYNDVEIYIDLDDSVKAIGEFVADAVLRTF